MRISGREALLALALSASAAGAFFHETLFRRDRSLGGLDNALAVLPWSTLDSWPPPRNRELADHAVAFYPWTSFLSREWRESGRLPLWNPHQSGGAPAAGNPQFRTFAPLRWLTLPWPPERAFAVQAFLKTALACFFTYLLARRLRISRLGSALAACGYAFGGFQTYWLLFPLTDAACFAPAVFLALETYRGTGSRRALAGLAASIGCVQLGGHPETAFYVTAAALSFGVLAAWRDLRGPGRLRRFARALLPYLGATAVGTALAAPVLLPSLEYLSRSSTLNWRREILQSTQALGPRPGLALVWVGILAAAFVLGRRLARSVSTRRLSLPAGALFGGACFLLVRLAGDLEFADSMISVLLPDALGHPAREGGYAGPPYFLLVFPPAYVGVLPFFLAFVSLLGTPPRRFAFYKGAALVAWSLSWHAPALDAAAQAIPFLRLGLTDRALGIANLAFGLLAGSAVADFERGGGRRRLGRAMATVFASALAFAIAAALFGVNPPSRGPAPPPADANSVLRDLEAKANEATRTLTIRAEAGDLPQGARVVFSLERGDGVSLPAVASLAGGECSATLDIASLPRGRYRILARAWNAEGVLVATSDGGVFTIPYRWRASPRALAAALAAGLVLLWLAWSPGRGGAAVSIVVSAADLFLFGSGFNPAVPAERVFPLSKVESFLRDDPDVYGPRRNGRVWANPPALPPNVATLRGFLDVHGYDAINVAAYDLVYRALVRQGPIGPRGASIRQMRTDWPLFDLLGVKYLLAEGTIEDPRFEPVFRGELDVYRNRGFRGIAWLAREAMLPREAKDLSEVDPARTVVLEERVSLWNPFREGEVSIREHASDRVVLDARLDGAGLLVLAENDFPGWRARVDGKPAPILRAFGTFRALLLGPADHEIVFEYRPLSVLLGACLSTAAAALLFGCCAAPRRRKRGIPPSSSLPAERREDSVR